MSTRETLQSYQRSGWVELSREPIEGGSKIRIKLTKKSSRLGDVGRSVGYCIGAPVVATVSLALSILAFVPGSCCCSAMGNQARADGDYDTAEKFDGAALESCSLAPSGRILKYMNEGLYDRVHPFQTTNMTRTFTISASLLDHED